jgi:hypothetical protein
VHRVLEVKLDVKEPPVLHELLDLQVHKAMPEKQEAMEVYHYI